MQSFEDILDLAPKVSWILYFRRFAVLFFIVEQEISLE